MARMLLASDLVRSHLERRLDDDARTMSRDGSYLAEKTARKIEFSARHESSESGIVSFRPLAEEKVKSIMKI